MKADDIIFHHLKKSGVVHSAASEERPYVSSISKFDRAILNEIFKFIGFYNFPKDIKLPKDSFGNFTQVLKRNSVFSQFYVYVKCLFLYILEIFSLRVHSHLNVQIGQLFF